MKKTIFLVFTLSCVLSACGRVSAPTREKGSFYPHTYAVTHSNQEEK